jgi:hypothetical protein
MTSALTDRIAARYMREAEQRQADQTALTLGNLACAALPNGFDDDEARKTTMQKSMRAFAPLIAAAGAMAAIGLAAPVAHADTNDGKFLAALKSEGIGDHISDAHAIEAGHFVCVKLDNGISVANVVNDVLYSSNMPAYHSGFFVGASIKEYCPQHMPEVSGT